MKINVCKISTHLNFHNFYIISLTCKHYVQYLYTCKHDFCQCSTPCLKNEKTNKYSYTNNNDIHVLLIHIFYLDTNYTSAWNRNLKALDLKP